MSAAPFTKLLYRILARFDLSFKRRRQRRCLSQLIGRRGGWTFGEPLWPRYVNVREREALSRHRSSTCITYAAVACIVPSSSSRHLERYMYIILLRRVMFHLNKKLNVYSSDNQSIILIVRIFSKLLFKLLDFSMRFSCVLCIRYYSLIVKNGVERYKGKREGRNDGSKEEGGDIYVKLRNNQSRSTAFRWNWIAKEPAGSRSLALASIAGERMSGLI